MTVQEKFTILNEVKAFLYDESQNLYDKIQMAELIKLTSEKAVLGFWDSNCSLLFPFLNADDRQGLLLWAFYRVGFPIQYIEYCDLSQFDESLLDDSACESPIEEMFFNACQNRLSVVPQYKIGRYRIDFALPQQKVAIELDGHEHHKTKEQRTSDASRERYLQKYGWQVIRFTGSEIYKDVQRCIQDVLEIISV